jgi:hypothetical protein
MRPVVYEIARTQKSAEGPLRVTPVMLTSRKCFPVYPQSPDIAGMLLARLGSTL